MKIIIYNKNNPCWLKVITNTLKKVLFSDEKNTQLFFNICCNGIKIDLRCNFIVTILTRTGLHIG